MSLPELLAELATLLPGRFVNHSGYFAARAKEKFRYVWILTDYFNTWSDAETSEGHLEYALREEIEARGWNWQYGCLVDMAGNPCVYAADVKDEMAYGDTPAAAFAAALIQAIKGQG